MMYYSRTANHLPTPTIVALGRSGPYRLTIHHASGVIVEYFHTTDDALHRQAELEDLLTAAQGFRVPALRMDAR
jgi:hypothetical protein